MWHRFFFANGNGSYSTKCAPPLEINQIKYKNQTIFSFFLLNTEKNRRLCFFSTNHNFAGIFQKGNWNWMKRIGSYLWVTWSYSIAMKTVITLPLKPRTIWNLIYHRLTFTARVPQQKHIIYHHSFCIIALLLYHFDTITGNLNHFFSLTSSFIYLIFIKLSFRIIIHYNLKFTFINFINIFNVFCHLFNTIIFKLIFN